MEPASLSLTPVFITLVTSIFAFLSLVFTTYMSFKTAQLNLKVDQSNVKVEEIQKTSTDTHTLVNSNMGVQLKLAMALSQRIAKLTKDPDDIAAAKDAERLYNEHVDKQAVVDADTKQDLAEKRNEKTS